MFRYYDLSLYVEQKDTHLPHPQPLPNADMIVLEMI